MSAARTVRVWSPLAVGLYALLLGYPSALILAVKNWKELGTRGRIRSHVIGALLFSLPFVAMLIFATSGRIVRFIALVTNVLAFSYAKEILASDLRDLCAANPDTIIEFRPWYTGLGWALLAIAAFVFFGTIIEIFVPE